MATLGRRAMPVRDKSEPSKPFGPKTGTEWFGPVTLAPRGTGRPGQPRDAGPGRTATSGGLAHEPADGNPTSGGRPPGQQPDGPRVMGANHEADGPAGPRTANLEADGPGLPGGQQPGGLAPRGTRLARTATARRPGDPADGPGNRTANLRASRRTATQRTAPGPMIRRKGQLAPILDCGNRNGTVQLAPDHSHSVASDTAPRTALARNSPLVPCTAPTRTVVQS